MVVINHSELLSCSFSNNIYQRQSAGEREQQLVDLRNLCQDGSAFGRPRTTPFLPPQVCNVTKGEKCYPSMPTAPPQSFLL